MDSLSTTAPAVSEAEHEEVKALNRQHFNRTGNKMHERHVDGHFRLVKRMLRLLTTDHETPERRYTAQRGKFTTREAAQSVLECAPYFTAHYYAHRERDIMSALVAMAGTKRRTLDKYISGAGLTKRTLFEIVVGREILDNCLLFDGTPYTKEMVETTLGLRKSDSEPETAKAEGVVETLTPEVSTAQDEELTAD